MNPWELTGGEIEAIEPTNLGGNEDDRRLAQAAQKKLMEWFLDRGLIFGEGDNVSFLPANGDFWLSREDLKILRKELLKEVDDGR